MGTRSLEGGKVQVQLTGNVKNSLSDGTTVASAPVNGNFSETISNGILVDQADRAWRLDVDIESGNSVVIDLADFAGIDIGAGAARDAIGQELSLTEVVAICISNENETAEEGQLEVKPDASNGWDPIGEHLITADGALKSGGLICKVQTASPGFEVIDGASHRLYLGAVGGDVSARVVLLGRSQSPSPSSSSSSSSSSGV